MAACAGPTGAAAVAEAISIAPTLLYDTQAGAEAVAIGLDIVRHHAASRLQNVCLIQSMLWLIVALLCLRSRPR